MHLSFSPRLPTAILASLLIATSAAAASAKRPPAHRLGFTATTRDLNRDGRIDAVDLHGRALHVAANTIRVSGHRVIAVKPIRGGVRVLISAARGPDTGSRPWVSVSLTKKRATDGAPPVLIGSPLGVGGAVGALNAVDLRFSERVIAQPGAVRVQGYSVSGMRAAASGSVTVLLRSTARSSTAAVPAVIIDGAFFRDMAGNRGSSGSVRMIAAGSGSAAGTTSASTGPYPKTTVGPSGLPTSPVATETYNQPGAGTTGNSTSTISTNTGSTTDSGGTGAPGNPPSGGPQDGTSTDGSSSIGDPVVSPLPGSGQPAFAGTVSSPFVESQMLPSGERSFYLQPWRSYEDTFPATRMLDAAGVNFNIYNGNTDQVSAGAKLLHDAGFTRARIEIGWQGMDYQNPSQLTAQELKIVTPLLQDFKANGIRPLILLNSNDGIPCPVQNVTLNVTAPAAAGATKVQLDSASAALVKPGFTGFRQQGRDSGVIITSVDNSGLATLSRPLYTAIAGGSQTATTLKYQPFFPPTNFDGSANANNSQTIAGWLQYVAGVTQTIKSILGNDNFDIEVWNELTFGSDFLNASNYYQPAPSAFGSITQEILLATTDYIRDSANGLSDVGIGDGFANETPMVSGGTEVPGVTAIDKHPYEGAKQFPSQATYNNQRPLDALGNSGGTLANGVWHDAFVPTFTSLFPEYFLTGIQAETATRDLGPFTSGTHGRYTHPAGAPAPTMWVTEVNEDASTIKNTLTSPNGTATSPMSAADLRHFESKAILRYLSAWVGKGVTAIDFYALANAGGLNLADQSFFTTAKSMHSYPGLAAAGETMVDVHRFLDTMAGAQDLSQITPLSLDSVSSYDNAYQFAGNGTAAYPPLYNRNMVGFFPFQVTAHKWVIPTYVMTLDLATLYNTSAPATDVTRQDMSPETFALTINGVNGETATASAVDPLSGSSVPVTITARTSSSISVQVPLTDSPRMLTLQDS